MQETINTMKKNVDAANERGTRLDQLQDKTDNLAVSAQGFRRGANRVRKQMWWKDMKMRMCIIAGIIILILIIVIPSKSHLCPSLLKKSLGTGLAARIRAACPDVGLRAAR